MLHLGIDVGGANIVAGVVDEDMKIIASSKLKSRAGVSDAEFCDDIERAAREAASQAGRSVSEFPYCGIGCPGIINSRDGIWEFSGNLGIESMPLRELMSRRLGIEIYVSNDADCAALGEVVAGAAKGAHSALVVTLGTGVGGGIVIDGRIYTGMNGIAGEIGHMAIFPGGEECSCGRRGCWEAYCSATALKRQTRTAMEVAPQSLMWKIAGSPDRVSGRTAFEAMRQGDPDGTLVVESYIYYLAEGLTNCINILQPEVVCIGGGICREGDDLLRPLREQVERYRFGRGTIPQPRIVCAQLQGEAGIIGAAMLGD